MSQALVPVALRYFLFRGYKATRKRRGRKGSKNKATFK
jgi:hypothetical protein